MQQVAKLAPRTSTSTKRSRADNKPFVAVEFTGNPWALCKQYQDCVPVTYGNINAIARALTWNLSGPDKFLRLQRRMIKRYPDGRAFIIKLRVKEDMYLGGSIWIRDQHGRSITIHDVKGMFQVNWPQLRTLYKTRDLVEVMTRTRASLDAVGLRADQQAWSRCSSLTDGLWRSLKIDLGKVPCVGVRKREPGNLQGYNVFGHTSSPVYFYDIRSAYLSEMAHFAELKPFTDHIWGARQELVQANDPAEFLVKLAGTIVPGKFSSTLPRNRYYRPILGKFIRQQVNDRLVEAMNEVSGYHNCFRWCVDGFIASEDISNRLDIGDNLGQWKPIEIHPHLTIARTNVWWTDTTHKDNGYLVTEAQVLQDPLEIHTNRRIFDWDTLEEHEQPVVLYQNHYEERCRACRNGEELHDRIARNVIPITEEDLR